MIVRMALGFLLFLVLPSHCMQNGMENTLEQLFNQHTDDLTLAPRYFNVLQAEFAEQMPYVASNPNDTDSAIVKRYLKTALACVFKHRDVNLPPVEIGAEIVDGLEFLHNNAPLYGFVFHNKLDFKRLDESVNGTDWQIMMDRVKHTISDRMAPRKKRRTSSPEGTS